MDEFNFPKPDAVRHGAAFEHLASVVSVRDGKHGAGDYRVDVNGRPISHQLIGILLMAVYVAEERYAKRGKKGGDYFFNYIFSVMVWTRQHLGKPSNALYPWKDFNSSEEL